MTKIEALQEYLKDKGSIAVAFSGGVDSTFLLKVAHDVLGDMCVAMTAGSLSFPEREMNEAALFCKENGIRQIVFESEEMNIEDYLKNPKDRCYYCKSALFEKMKRIADDNDIAYIAEGSNLDDNGDYRPGLKAVAEQGILSPLRENGFTKEDIRSYSREMGLPTWDKQSFACLASRFVYGDRITADKLKMIDRAEQTLSEMGLKKYRVRLHSNLARIEVSPDDMEIIIENREKIVKEFKEIGFIYVTLDVQGFRSGSMNEIL